MEGSHEAEELLTNIVNKISANRVYNKQEVLQQLGTVVHYLQQSSPVFDQAVNFIQQAIHTLEQYIAQKRPGRPEASIPYERLEFLLDTGLKVNKIAALHNVSSKTVFRKMKNYGLGVRQLYSGLNDNELDDSIKEILVNHPNTGYKRMRGFLKSRGIKVPTRQLLMAMRRVDPEGVEQRKRQNRAIYRRQYFVKHSMALWHIDTHHKLIRYGFVVRGGIDGKSRTIVYLDAGCDNKSSSNLKSFLQGVRRFGVPIRTRSDKGGENIGVAKFMLRMRGENRGSHICGRSSEFRFEIAHRIERLWRDVHYGCLTGYKQMFTYLENSGYLELDNPRKLAVLQYIFLPRIRQSLQEFADSWNHHAMTSENGQTPLQQMLLHLPPPNSDIIPTEEQIAESLLLDANEDFETQNMVTVEPFQEFLSEADLQILGQMDIMRVSHNLGADIYIEAINSLF